MLTHFWWFLFCKKPGFHFNGALHSGSLISIPKFFSTATPMLKAKVVVYQTRDDIRALYAAPSTTVSSAQEAKVTFAKFGQFSDSGPAS